MSSRNYLHRIRIPLQGPKNFLFFTKSCLRVANGYQKVIVDNKPMVEFSHSNLVFENLKLHRKLKKKDGSEWVEYKTKDYCEIKIQYSMDNKRFYCSLKDLMCKERYELMDPCYYRIKSLST